MIVPLVVEDIEAQKTPQNTPAQKAVIFLLQLGGPADLTEITPFLRNLFADVLPLPKFLANPIAGVIAKQRTPKVIPLYQAIGGGSPLLVNTQAQADALQAHLATLGIEAHVLMCMRYAPPRAKDMLAIARQLYADIPWIALPLYPHYSFATTRSSMREINSLLTKQERQHLRVVHSYAQDPLYLDAMAEVIQEQLATLSPEQRSEVHVVFSAHGLPMKLVREGDPYPEHINQTIEGIISRIDGMPPYTLSYQSKVGPVRWLEPSTVTILEMLGQEGVKCLMVVPISFVSEHIETLHELDVELREIAEAAGVETYIRVPTLGARADFVTALAHQVLQALSDDCQKNEVPAKTY